MSKEELLNEMINVTNYAKPRILIPYHDMCFLQQGLCDLLRDKTSPLNVNALGDNHAVSIIDNSCTTTENNSYCYVIEV